MFNSDKTPPVHNGTVNDRVLTILAVLVACGLPVFGLAPYMETLFSEEFHIAIELASDIISIELLGCTLASIPVAILVNKISWRRTLYIASGVLVLVNLGSCFLDDFTVFLAARFISGFAGGVINAICLAVINRSGNPARSVGFWLMVSLLVFMCLLLVLPALTEHFGEDTLFILLAMITIIMALVFIRYVPEEAELGRAPEVNTSEPVYRLAALGFVGIFFAFLATSGVWSLYEVLGETKGIAKGAIDYYLAGSIFFAAFGALSATLLSTRFGLLIPLVAGVALFILSLVMVLHDFTEMVFIASVCLFGFAQYFVKPYFTACIANIDESGRLMVLTGLVIGMGASAGPAAAGLLHGHLGSYAPVLFMGISVMTVALLAVLKLALQPPKGVN